MKIKLHDAVLAQLEHEQNGITIDRLLRRKSISDITRHASRVRAVLLDCQDDGLVRLEPSGMWIMSSMPRPIGSHTIVSRYETSGVREQTERGVTCR